MGRRGERETLMRRVYVFLVLSLAGAPGCYRFHGADPGTPDGGLVSRDAPPAAVPDVRWPSSEDAALGDRDAWVPDGGPVLPPDPPPDPGPDGRPSDDPEGWIDPPALGPDDPCCTLSEPVRLAARPETALSDDAPLLAWGADGWGLVVTRLVAGDGLVRSLLAYSLQADGTPTRPAQTLEPPVTATPPRARALRWAGGRWAFAVSDDGDTGSERELHVRLFDARFAPASTWTSVGTGTDIDLAHLAHGDQWLAFSSLSDALRTTPLDERGGAGAAVDASSRWARIVRAAGLGSRAVVAPLGTVEDDASLLVVDGAGAVLGVLPHGVDPSIFRGGSMTALRDVALLAVRRESRVEVEVADPFELRWLHAPAVIGDAGSESAALPHGLDVVGSARLGVAGLCWGVPGVEGRGEQSRILFRLVGEDGQPRGTAVTITTSSFRGSLVNCSVGTDERGFLVGWWNGTELWVRRVDVAG